MLTIVLARYEDTASEAMLASHGSRQNLERL